jgi:hypothetical protein
VRRFVLAVALLGGCGDLTGFGGAIPPLATIELEVTGQLPPAAPPASGDQPPDLQVALVWGAQWLTEPFCILPAESDQVAAVIAAGCRDPFGFVPARVAANVAVQLNAPTSLPLFALPSADIMIGDVTARVAYGSFVVYDDRNGNGTLDLTRPNHTPSGGRRGGGDMGDEPTQAVDIVYGASFVTMTAPDQRLAYREGGFDTTAAFYPRNGCGAPLPGFSILAAGGFSAAAGIAAAETGALPAEDPSTCGQDAPDAATVTFPVQAPGTAVGETACVERVDDSSARYREPPADAPDLTNRLSACAHLPAFGTGSGTGSDGSGSGTIQLVVSGRSDDACQGLTHYTLRGCDTDPQCTAPDWDLTASPPAWWPCPVQTP